MVLSLLLKKSPALVLTDVWLLRCEKSLRRSDIIQEAFGTELISETIPQFLLRAVVDAWDAVRWDAWDTIPSQTVKHG